jgi:hypothetical protein
MRPRPLAGATRRTIGTPPAYCTERRLALIAILHLLHLCSWCVRPHRAAAVAQRGVMSKSRELIGGARSGPLLGIISVLGLGAALTFLLGLGALFPESPLHDIWNLNPDAQRAFGPSRPAASMLLFALGLLCASTASGLYRNKEWAWWSSVTVFSIVFLFNVSRLVSGDRAEYFGTPFTAVLLILHFIPSVRTPSRRRSAAGRRCSPAGAGQGDCGRPRHRQPRYGSCAGV